MADSLEFCAWLERHSKQPTAGRYIPVNDFQEAIDDSEAALMTAAVPLKLSLCCRLDLCRFVTASATSTAHALFSEKETCSTQVPIRIVW